ncbi:MAG: NADPH-dependent ferric siderophore reductase [Glaciihabitans sp.]|nr:NADPH-dependent ferric siderophore reductase [Glaciihabitans sp.]
MSENTPRPQRPQRPQTVLAVESTEWLSPHLVRVIVGGDGFANFQTNGATDKYVKVFFVKPQLGLTPPYDVETLRAILPQEDWPVVRTYTVRWVDEVAQKLAIDFVVHGDEGIAGPWAASAVAGDLIAFAGPGGAYSPDPVTQWHVLAGDESAIPAMASALEAMGPDARGVAYIEVDTVNDVLDLAAPDGVDLHWVFRDGQYRTTLLAESIDGGPWPEHTSIQAFMHGEREAMKALRVVLRRRGLTREQISLSGYWARGRTEDAFQAEKREPIGQIAD